MLSLNLPAFDAKIAARNGKNVIFDVIRRRYVALTLKNGCGSTSSTFFLLTKGYPQALMANEVAGTTERYKEAAVIQCSIGATLPPG